MDEARLEAIEEGAEVVFDPWDITITPRAKVVASLLCFSDAALEQHDEAVRSVDRGATLALVHRMRDEFLASGSQLAPYAVCERVAARLLAEFRKW